MRNTGLEEAQAAIKTAGRNINNLRYAADTTLMVESEEALLCPWADAGFGPELSWVVSRFRQGLGGKLEGLFHS